MVLLRNLGLIVILLCACAFSSSAADIEAELSIDDGRVTSFYLAIGKHYQIPDEEIIIVKRQNISDDELAVVFYLARKARVKHGVIVDLRLHGMTWMEITSHYGLTAEIFHIVISGTPGPPYGRALGHFKSRHRSEWHSIRLSDNDIVNLVNLRFVSGRHGLGPDVVIKMREQGQSFIAINDKILKAKAAKKAKTGDKPKKDKPHKGGKAKR